MCSVAKGVARGRGKHYGERIAIDERQVHAHGRPECVIELRLTN